MNQKLLLFFALLFSTGLYSQVDSTKISIAAYWSIGDSYDFKISKVDQEWRDEVLTKKDSSQHIANFKVVDSTENSYTVEWTYKNSLFNTVNEGLMEMINDPEVLENIAKANEVNKVIYETDEVGEFIQVLNWKELGEATSSYMENVIVGVLKERPDITEQKLRDFLQPFKETFSTQQGIEEFTVDEIQLFHYLLGYDYDITEPIEFDQEFPNMFGGDPIMGETILTFEEVDFEESFCSVLEKTTINAEDSKRVIYSFLEKIMPDKTEFERVLDNTLLDIKDLNYFQFYYNPGIPHYIYHGRKVEMNVDGAITERINETYIELVYEEE